MKFYLNFECIPNSVSAMASIRPRLLYPNIAAGWRLVGSRGRLDVAVRVMARLPWEGFGFSHILSSQHGIS